MALQARQRRVKAQEAARILGRLPAKDAASTAVQLGLIGAGDLAGSKRELLAAVIDANVRASGAARALARGGRVIGRAFDASARAVAVRSQRGRCGAHRPAVCVWRAFECGGRAHARAASAAVRLKRESRKWHVVRASQVPKSLSGLRNQLQLRLSSFTTTVRARGCAPRAATP